LSDDNQLILLLSVVIYNSKLSGTSPKSEPEGTEEF